MDDILVTTVLAGSKLFYAIGFLLPPVALVYMFRALAHLKPGVTMWHVLNPLNHMFFASHFTEKGLKYRRRSLIAIAAFLLIWFAGIGLDALNNRLTSRPSSPAAPAAER